MSSAKKLAPSHVTRSSIIAAINDVHKLIPKTWPLREAIAVNPWDESTDKSITSCFSLWQTFTRANTIPPLSFYKKELEGVELDPESLVGVCQRYNVSLDDIKSNLDDTSKLFKVHTPIAYTSNSLNEKINKMFFDLCGNIANNTSSSIYGHWYKSNLSKLKELNLIIQSSPYHAGSDYRDTLATILNHLGVNTDEALPFLFSIATQFMGWCSYFKYTHKNSDITGELICIRLINEIIEAHRHKISFKFWRIHFNQNKNYLALNQKRIHVSLALLDVIERKYQLEMQKQLTNHTPQVTRKALPKVQAVFCIDTRSERIRRHIENTSDEIETLGVAGFFSLPIKIKDSMSSQRISSHPGILDTNIEVSFYSHNNITQTNAQGLYHKLCQHPLLQFKMVEFTGLGEGFNQVKQLFRRKQLKKPSSLDISYQLTNEHNKTLSDNEKIELCEGFLLSLSTKSFCKTMYVFGHQSNGENNAEISQLQCGACGGQTGLINAMVICDLLNTPDIRQALIQKGFAIDETQFIAGIHETVTDELLIFKENITTETKFADKVFKIASTQARLSKENDLPTNQSSNSSLLKAVDRSQDISFIRTEWGLAKHKHFIIAPRQMTKGLNLKARVFLHDYDQHQDNNSELLTSILAGPVNVASWINMQYYASTVDNSMFGSGDKLLHQATLNGHALIEGESGDLRFGLSKQSVFNKEDYYHQPLRLSVYIAASQNSINNALKQCASVKNLVENNWLHLFQIDNSQKVVARWSDEQWVVLN